MVKYPAPLVRAVSLLPVLLPLSATHAADPLDPFDRTVFEGVKVGRLFGKIETDEELDRHANLGWESGSLSFNAGDSFSEEFGSRGLDHILGVLTNDVDGFEDDQFRAGSQVAREIAAARLAESRAVLGEVAVVKGR